MNAGYCKAINLCTKPASRVHKSASVSRALGKLELAYRNGVGSAEGISECPHALPQSFLQKITTLGNFPPRQIFWHPRQNWVRKRMRSNGHPSSLQLLQSGSIKRKKSVGLRGAIDDAKLPIFGKTKLLTDFIEESASEFSIEPRKLLD